METFIVIVAVAGLADILVLKVLHRRDMARYGFQAKWYW